MSKNIKVNEFGRRNHFDYAAMSKKLNARRDQLGIEKKSFANPGLYDNPWGSGLSNNEDPWLDALQGGAGLGTPRAGLGPLGNQLGLGDQFGGEDPAWLKAVRSGGGLTAPDLSMGAQAGAPRPTSSQPNYFDVDIPTDLNENPFPNEPKGPLGEAEFYETQTAPQPQTMADPNTADPLVMRSPVGTRPYQAPSLANYQIPSMQTPPTADPATGDPLVMKSPVGTRPYQEPSLANYQIPSSQPQGAGTAMPPLKDWSGSPVAQNPYEVDVNQPYPGSDMGYASQAAPAPLAQNPYEVDVNQPYPGNDMGYASQAAPVAQAQAQPAAPSNAPQPLGAPTEAMLRQFQKGTSSTYNPKSWLDRNKMNSLMSGNSSWSNNAEARNTGNKNYEWAK